MLNTPLTWDLLHASQGRSSAMASTLVGLQRLEEVQPAAEQQHEQANIRSAEAVSNLESNNFEG